MPISGEPLSRQLVLQAELQRRWQTHPEERKAYVADLLRVHVARLEEQQSLRARARVGVEQAYNRWKELSLPRDKRARQGWRADKKAQKARAVARKQEIKEGFARITHDPESGYYAVVHSKNGVVLIGKDQIDITVAARQEGYGRLTDLTLGNQGPTDPVEASMWVQAHQAIESAVLADRRTAAFDKIQELGHPVTDELKALRINQLEEFADVLGEVLQPEVHERGLEAIRHLRDEVTENLELTPEDLAELDSKLNAAIERRFGQSPDEAAMERRFGSDDGDDPDVDPPELGAEPAGPKPDSGPQFDMNAIPQEERQQVQDYLDYADALEQHANHPNNPDPEATMSAAHLMRQFPTANAAVDRTPAPQAKVSPDSPTKALGKRLGKK